MADETEVIAVAVGRGFVDELRLDAVSQRERWGVVLDYSKGGVATVRGTRAALRLLLVHAEQMFGPGEALASRKGAYAATRRLRRELGLEPFPDHRAGL